MSSNIVGQSITFANGVTAPNRILKMTERLCTWGLEFDDRGRPTPEYIELYRQWGLGGTGIIVLGNLPCDVRYPEAARNACIDPKSSWDQVEAFKPVVAATKAGGGLCIGQITHAGRQTSDTIAPVPLAPSSNMCKGFGGMNFGLARAMTIEEVEDVVQRYAFAAEVLYKAGADGCQLHAAHGYLLSQFLSPVTNKREDRYGGPFENRSRIVFEIIDEIQKRVTDKKFMITIKINSADFQDGGFTEEESEQMCKALEEKGLTLIELSGGNYETIAKAWSHKNESTKKREAFFIEFAARIRPHLKSAKLAVTGGFRSTEAMSQAINEKSCDICGVARPLTAQPDFSNLLIQGQQDAAPDNKVDRGLQTAASYFQIYEISTGRTPSNFSKDEIAKRITNEIKKNTGAALRFRIGGTYSDEGSTNENTSSSKL